MKIIYLGQAGLLFETDNKIILIDPYLSDSVAKIQPNNYRRVPVDARFLELKPDIIVCTHNHADHMDKETLGRYLSENSEILVLAPYSAWKEIREFGGLKNNYVMFNVGTEWTEDNVSFQAVKAEHSDPYAIGVILSSEGENYYVTGDTLYNQEIFESLPKRSFEMVFLPINGKGNNMNCADAQRFMRKLEAKYAVPVHIGMFDEMTADDFQYEGKIIPKIYKEINKK